MNTVPISIRVVMRVTAVCCFFLFGSIAVAEDKITAEEARAIAKEAYIFNYPLVMYYRTMYVQAIDPKSKSYSGGFGHWLHLQKRGQSPFLFSVIPGLIQKPLF
jgi:hypothetical protein